MNDARKRLRETLDALPERRLAEVLDFAEFLHAREKSERESDPASHDSAGNPILDYVGGVSHGKLA
jgi:hypothetical protein